MPPRPAAEFAEAELLPLSGLQHLVFCERQCALIHLEQAWRENALTAQGRVLHERVDSGTHELRADLRVLRGVPLRSLRLGLVGRADVIELRSANGCEHGARLPGLNGNWHVFPVEYKRGSPKWIDCDRVQLCAQALSLEEMTGTEVPRGALFYGAIRRREEVEFDEELRLATVAAAERFHEILAAGKTPIVYRAPKCKSCSLLPICLPPNRRRPSVRRYIAAAIANSSS